MSELHPSVAGLIDTIKAAGKDLDWVGDFHLVVDLDRLAREQDFPPSGELCALLDVPLNVGGVVLHRLSLGAANWYQQLAKVWWGDNDYLLNIALVWAHAHSRNPDAIRRMSEGERGARWSLRMWGLTRGVPWEALLAGVDALLPPRVMKVPGEEASTGSNRTMSMVARLVTATGLPEEHWLFSVSHEQVTAALTELAERSNLDHARMAALLGVRLSEADDSWAMQSFRRYRAAAKSLLDKYGVEQNKRTKRTFQTLEKEVG